MRFFDSTFSETEGNNGPAGAQFLLPREYLAAKFASLGCSSGISDRCGNVVIVRVRADRNYL